MDNIEHHGIEGQKWGIRRFQNKDGSLTRLGKERRMENDGPEDPEKERLKMELREEMRKEQLNSLKKDNELLRAQVENNDLIKKVNAINNPPKKEGKIKKLIGEVLYESAKEIAKAGLIDLGKHYVGIGVNKIINKKSTAKTQTQNQGKKQK